jgi:RimJ/RimL family protein N-acetyltransferase
LAIVPTSNAPASIDTRADVSFRPATVADARAYADLWTAHRPDEPEDPERAAHGWAHPIPDINFERYLVEVGGRPSGYAYHDEHPADKDPERNGYLEAWLVPNAYTPERQRAVMEFIEERSLAAGVRVFNFDAWEDEADVAALVLDRGYARDRLSKAWELDLDEHRDRLLLLAGRAEALMREQGIDCHPLADDPDPAIWRLTYEAQAEAAEDAPRTEPYVRPTFEQFRTWYSGPDTDPRWFFVAKDGGRVVGISALHFPPVRGNVWTSFTGVVRSHRGRGVARGVKMAVLKQAVLQNVSRVRTDNDETNAAMLHINEDLGYQRIPGVVSYRRPV